MIKVLVVEDSKAYMMAIKRSLKIDFKDIDICSAYSLAETEAILKDNPADEFLVAVLDLNLPDAPDGEIIDLVNEHKIPAIVLTATFTDELQEFIWTRKIVDYVVKEGAHSLGYVSKRIKRFYKNLDTKIMVVDDSRMARKHVINLLESQKFILIEAGNGREALDFLAEQPDIKMIITDYHMPVMDGFELTKQVRKHYDPETVAIIGISSSESNKLSVRFIKNGANDFITKPFLSEQFYCRVNQNLDIIEHVDGLKTLAETDFLTNLYNRRHFFRIGKILLDSSDRNKMDLVVAMIDIDHFKKINDTYGHDMGDVALRKISDLLKESFRKTDIVARFGGEEFCVAVTNTKIESVFNIFDQVRLKIQDTDIAYNNQTINCTVSIGACLEKMDTMEKMVTVADKKLYEAKEGGRNRVVF